MNITWSSLKTDGFRTESMLRTQTGYLVSNAPAAICYPRCAVKYPVNYMKGFLS